MGSWIDRWSGESLPGHYAFIDGQHHFFDTREELENYLSLRAVDTAVP